MLSFFLLPLVTVPCALVALRFPVAQAPIFFSGVGLMLGWFFTYIVLFLRFMWWRCPRCSRPFFGWWPIPDVRWWHIVSCVHCGLHADAPDAKSCRDRREIPRGR